MDQKDIDVLLYHTQINHYTLLTLCGLSETEQSVTVRCLSNVKSIDKLID